MNAENDSVYEDAQSKISKNHIYSSYEDAEQDLKYKDYNNDNDYDIFNSEIEMKVRGRRDGNDESSKQVVIFEDLTQKGGCCKSKCIIY